MQNVDGGGEENDMMPTYSPAQNRQIVMPVAQPFFPSAILSVVPTIIEMFDDVQIDKNGACGIASFIMRFNLYCVMSILTTLWILSIGG